MADRISYKIDVDINDTVKAVAARTVTVEAYGKIEVDVPAKTNDTDGKAVLNPLPDKIQFLLITSSEYGDELTLKQDNNGLDFALSEPLMLAGGKALELLEVENKEITITNGIESTVHVQILVGWDAVQDEDGS